MKKLNLPLNENDIKNLKAGDAVLLSGTVYTARDCAHKRIFELIKKEKKLPFELNGATVYYAGPCPAKPGKVCGSCGPTTSARMDVYAPKLIDLGLKGIIGKGEMSDEVRTAIKNNGAVYFAAIGGAGALYGNAIKSFECVAFPDLLSEAVYKLKVEDFPVLVAYDCFGGSIY